MKNRLLSAVALLLIVLMLSARGIPDLPGPIGIPGLQITVSY